MCAPFFNDKPPHVVVFLHEGVYPIQAGEALSVMATGLVAVMATAVACVRSALVASGEAAAAVVSVAIVDAVCRAGDSVMLVDVG